MKKNWIGGNWKMNSDKAFIDSYFAELGGGLDQELGEIVDVAIFPPACYLKYAKSKLSTALNSMVGIGAQDISNEERGAYTGHISAQMVKDCGGSYALIGEAEVRNYLGVTDEQVHDQQLLALQQGLTPVICVGEPLEVYDAGTYAEYISNQLQNVFTVSLDEIIKCIIVYEPLWAMGTGRTCDADTAEERCAYVRYLVADRYGAEIAEDYVRICYGGAVNARNAVEILSKPNIDGALVAGASLKIADFIAIIDTYKR